MRDVLIVGAGPVGMSATLALVRQGVSVTVIEAEPTLTTFPKASTLHPPTLEVLAAWGVLQDVEAAGIKVDRFQYWDRHENRLVAEFDFNLLRDDTPYPYRLQCEQYRLTAILYEHVKRSGLAQCFFGERVVSLEQDEQGARVYTQRGQERAIYEAAYVLGADGAKSVVRHQLAIPFEGMTYPELYLTFGTDFDFTTVYPRLAPVSYFFDPVHWFALIQTTGMWKVLFPLPLETNEQEAMTDEAIFSRLRAAMGLTSPVHILFRGTYRVHQRVARAFFKGRTLLLGDAAHVNNPLGGMGMNGGIHDAYFLASKLLPLYHGQGSTQLLEEYDRVRREIAERYVQEQTIRNEREVRYSEEQQRRRRNEEMQRMASNPALARTYLLRTSMLDGFRSMFT